jgi:hypothetical protein
VKLNLASGARPLDGFENLDATNGWRFEQGLNYADESIEAITESHGLMFVALSDWPYVFSEIERVLQPGGVVRITEDATDDRRSSRYGGFHDAVTLTSRDLVRAHMEIVGLDVRDVSEVYSYFKDDSLKQRWHGSSPKVFFVEGIKP